MRGPQPGEPHLGLWGLHKEASMPDWLREEVSLWLPHRVWAWLIPGEKDRSGILHCSQNLKILNAHGLDGHGNDEPGALQLR